MPVYVAYRLDLAYFVTDQALDQKKAESPGL